MADIRVTKAHQLGKEAALERARQVADRISAKGHAQARVVGDTVEVKATGASGRIVVDDTTVTVEGKIGLALRPMRKLIERKIDEYLERYLQ